MNGKRFARLTISLTLVLLVIVGAVQVAIDPLFQYHYPWFGLEPVITDERYQNAGVAKNFDYENVIIGNSLSENFVVSDVEKVFGGKTVKLTAAGSNPVDWTRFLKFIANRETKPKTILLQLDPYRLTTSTTESKANLPDYLFDESKLTDVNYLFNFEIINRFTYNTISKNRSGNIPDYDTVFMWDNEENQGRKGKDFVLKNYKRPQNTDGKIISSNKFNQSSIDNMELLTPYFEEMPNTRFVIFFAPLSILFWNSSKISGTLSAYRTAYLTAISELMDYDNVSVYFWSDEEMLRIMDNLDNYSDEEHYNTHINKVILNRIDSNQGQISKTNYKEAVNLFFDYLESYDYDAIFT